MFSKYFLTIILMKALKVIQIPLNNDDVTCLVTHDTCKTLADKEMTSNIFGGGNT